jgi:hypothetical protein
MTVMTGMKAQHKADKTKERYMMAKANDSSKKAADPAVGSKATVTSKATQAKTDITPKEPTAKKDNAPVANKAKTPVTEKGKAPVKQAANKAAASKVVASQADDAKKNSASKASTTKPAQKAKGAFAKKMDEVKSTATVIGHKITDFAKDANKKTEGFEDAVASGLHEMKKDIHRIAVNIAEKTEE